MSKKHSFSKVEKKFSNNSVSSGSSSDRQNSSLKRNISGVIFCKDHFQDSESLNGIYYERNIGEVLSITMYGDESDRSVAVVRWTTGDIKKYYLGHKGKVDLKCIDETAGGYIYATHLPFLNEYNEKNFKGLRVVNVGNIGKKGQIGTIIEKSNNTIVLQWDRGFLTELVLSPGKIADVCVVDNAPCGIVHRKYSCVSCKRPWISGFRWHCKVCPTVNICSQCYMNDRHFVSHPFYRYNDSASSRIEVTKRNESMKLPIFGIFPEAKVVLYANRLAIEDSWNISEVVSICDCQNVSARSMAVVKYPSGIVVKYCMGHEGKAQLKFLEEASGGYYYRDHLPILGNPSVCKNNVMDFEVGLRIVRGPNQPKENIGIEGHVGTIVDKISYPTGKKIFIKWDSGVQTHLILKTLTILKDLYVWDNAPTGTKHTSVKCNSCKIPSITGFRWKCRKCSDFNLCTSCYMCDKHDIHHEFSRFNNISSKGDHLPKRFGCTKVLARGIFPGAKVIVHLNEDYQQSKSGEEERNVAKQLDQSSVKATITNASEILHNDEKNIVGNQLVNQAFLGNSIEVKELLQNFPDIINYKKYGKTALHVAILKDKIEVVQLLLSFHADVEVADNIGGTPLHYSALKCDTAIMMLLLEHGANINAVNCNQQTALHLAILHQNTKCVKILIEKSCNINLQDLNKNTALHLAIDINNVEIIQMIMGVPSTNYLLKNNNGNNIIRQASMRKNNDVAKNLIERLKLNKSNLNKVHQSTFADSRETERIMTADDQFENQKDATENLTEDLLLLAVKEGNCSSVENLVKQGAKFNVEDHDGNTALHLALMNYAEHRIAVLENVIDAPIIHSISEELLMNGMKNNNTCLAIVCFLIQNKCDLDHFNHKGITPRNLLDSLQLLSTIENYTILEKNPQGFSTRDSTEINNSVKEGSPVCMQNADSRSDIIYLERKLRQIEQAFECSICMERQMDVAFLCGHRVCSICAETMIICHICRQTVKTKIRLY